METITSQDELFRALQAIGVTAAQGVEPKSIPVIIELLTRRGYDITVAHFKHVLSPPARPEESLPVSSN
jgi:hypothetical protein